MVRSRCHWGPWKDSPTQQAQSEEAGAQGAPPSGQVTEREVVLCARGLGLVYTYSKSLCFRPRCRAKTPPASIGNKSKAGPQPQESARQVSCGGEPPTTPAHRLQSFQLQRQQRTQAGSGVPGGQTRSWESQEAQAARVCRTEHQRGESHRVCRAGISAWYEERAGGRERTTERTGESGPECTQACDSARFDSWTQWRWQGAHEGPT